MVFLITFFQTLIWKKFPERKDFPAKSFGKQRKDFPKLAVGKGKERLSLKFSERLIHW